MDSIPTSEMVMISESRLQELEDLESKLPKLIEEALKAHKASVLNRLHQRDKENPQAVNLRVKRYANKHRETINRKRRERRKEKAGNVLTDTIKANKCDIIFISDSTNITNASTVKKPPIGGTTINFSD
jgi:hypothetical protein